MLKNGKFSLKLQKGDDLIFDVIRILFSDENRHLKSFAKGKHYTASQLL